MTSELRTQAYNVLDEISQNLEIYTRTTTVDTSFDFEGVNYQVVGNLYNHFEQTDAMCGVEDKIIDFTFKGTIKGFSKEGDECVLTETEMKF